MTLKRTKRLLKIFRLKRRTNQNQRKNSTLPKTLRLKQLPSNQTPKRKLQNWNQNFEKLFTNQPKSKRKSLRSHYVEWNEREKQHYISHRSKLMTPMINERRRRSNDMKKCLKTWKKENRKSGKRKKSEKRKMMRKNSLNSIRNKLSSQVLMEPFRLFSKILARVIL